MKKILIGALFLTSTFYAQAQVDERYPIMNLMPQIGIPLGDVKKTNGILLGGNLQYEGPISDKTRFLVQLGGGLLQGKNYDTDLGYEDDYPAIALMQLRGGAKFFVSEHFFVAGLAGAARSVVQGESSIGFSYAPVIGYEFFTGRYFDVNLRYDASNFKSYNLNIATFSIGYHL